MTAGLPEGDGTPAGIGKPPRHPGKAAVMGPRRPHLSRHSFVGPNVTFTPGQGTEGAHLRKLGLELLRKAARLEILAPRAREVRVKVTNVGAGHGIPTGVSELREMWLEVTVTDRRGRALLRLGGLDGEGNVAKEPGVVIYRTEVHDAEGKDTTLFWNTVKKVSDRRIPPLASVVERFALPAKARGPVKVAVKLLYRSVPPWGLKEAGLSPDKIKVPVLTMAEAQRTLNIK